jgi:hypothetical protein
MSDKNRAPLWFKLAYKAATAPLRTKIAVVAVGMAFAAVARIATLQTDITHEPVPQEPQTPAPTEQQTVTEAAQDHTRLLAAYASMGMDPPPEIMHQSKELLEAVRAPKP